MEKDSTPTQRGKGYLKKPISKTEALDVTEKVVFYETGTILSTPNENSDLVDTFKALKSTLHGEASNLCEWQLPPISKKENCNPVCIDSIEK